MPVEVPQMQQRTMKLAPKSYVPAALAVGLLVWTVNAIYDSLTNGSATLSGAFFSPMSLVDILFRLALAALIGTAVVLFLRRKERHRTAQGEVLKHLAAVESSMDGIAIFDADHVYRYANDAYARITGFGSPDDLQGKSFSLIYDAQQVSWIEQNIFPVLERKGRWYGELVGHRKDGTLLEQDASITQLQDRTCICVIRDITGRRRKEEELRRSERFLNTIFDSIRDPFCIIDRSYTIVRANEAYAQLKNRAVDDLIDRTCYKALEEKSEVCDGCIIRKTLQSMDPCAKEKKVTLKSGETLWMEIFTYPILDDAGEVSHVIEYTRDVTDRKKSEEDRRRLIERLEYLSKIDSLTGLLSRRALSEQLEYEIDRARRYKAELAVILCDLDNLKAINDNHGHLAGDATLQLLAATLRSSLRNVDIAGRYGGDEFLVIVPQTSAESALSIAEKMRRAAERTEVRLEGDKRVAMSLSIGVAGLGPLPEDMDGLISRVDAALYASKNAGRNKVSLAP
jgi:diguanylate cyclase (GGDEF)-like protein/PAS domain S-box-containing protein